MTVKRLDTIRGLALRLDELLNSLLEYSRRSRADLQMVPVSLDDVLDDVEEILGARFAETDVQLRRPMRLGVFSGDRIRLQEVLVNLISHAVEYAAADLPRWVEVGYRDVVPPSAGQPVRAFYVRDNGTASGPSSSHTPSAGWTSRALAAAATPVDDRRRIVERQEGGWVGSAGSGTTFYLPSADRASCVLRARTA